VLQPHPSPKAPLSPPLDLPLVLHLVCYMCIKGQLKDKGNLLFLKTFGGWTPSASCMPIVQVHPDLLAKLDNQLQTWCKCKTNTSSAYNFTLEYIQEGKSLMYSKNSNGARTAPWRTADDTGLGWGGFFDYLESHTVICQLEKTFN